MLRRLTSDDFDSTIQAGLVLVDFSADWCGPCRDLEPVLARLQEAYANVPFYRVDADEAPHVMLQLKFFSLPTVAIFRDGKLVGHVIGVCSTTEKEIKELLDQS